MVVEVNSGGKARDSIQPKWLLLFDDNILLTFIFNIFIDLKNFYLKTNFLKLGVL